MKRILVSMLLAMTLNAQNSLKLEETGPTTEEVNVAKGTATDTGDNHEFTSEDGTVKVTVRRGDLVKPIVTSAFAGGVYTYKITNGAAAEYPIEMINLLRPGSPAVEVL